MSTLRQLFSVNSIIALTLAIGFINNVAIAAIFGLSREVDVYFASFMMVRLVMVLIVDYLGKNFLPIYAAKKMQSADEASRLTSLVVTQVGLLSIVIAGMMALFSDKLFALILPGFNSADIELVVSMFTIMAPSLFLLTIDVFHSYVWQHGEQYSRVVASKVFRPLTRLIFILGLTPWLGIKALPLGFLCGQFVTSVALAIGVPYKFRPRLSTSDTDFRKIIRSSSILVGTGAIARSRSLIIQYFASSLGEGAIAAISIAQKICKPVYQSAQVGLRMIVFTRTARAAARDNLERIAKLHKLGIMGLLFFVMPVAVWYAFEASVIVEAVFQRGRFTAEDSDLIVAALLGYTVSIVFMGMIQMVSNGFYALDKIKVPAIAMPVSSVFFLILTNILGPRFGIIGLTASSSIMSLALGITLLTLFKRFVPTFDLAAIAKIFFRYLLTSLIAVILAQKCRQLFELGSIAAFLLSGGVSMTLYFLLNLVTRDPLIEHLMTKYKERKPA